MGRSLTFSAVSVIITNWLLAGKSWLFALFQLENGVYLIIEGEYR
jgi:hypothetical protein